MEQGDSQLGETIQATNTRVLRVADFYGGQADYIGEIRCLPQPNPWHPYEVLAVKPLA